MGEGPRPPSPGRALRTPDQRRRGDADGRQRPREPGPALISRALTPGPVWRALIGRALIRRVRIRWVGSAGPGSGGAGDEPDARFTFANERTFLAWIRTALALVAAGLAIVQLLPPFHGIRWGRHAIGIPLILLGAVVAVRSYQEWAANQRALRRGGPLRRSWLPELLAVVIALVAVVAATLALVSG